MTISDRAAALAAMNHDALVLLALAKERECAELREKSEAARIAFNANMKILSDLLDRAYKMHLMAIPSLRVTEQNSGSFDPIVAWMSDVRSVLYRNQPIPNPHRDLTLHNAREEGIVK